MMTPQKTRSTWSAVVPVIFALCFASIAEAGPPLICHSFEIGQSKSLPLASRSWNLTGSENYDTKNLALAWFDVGYLVETYGQWIGANLPHMTDGMRMDRNPAAGVDGYAMIKKALALRGAASHGDDAQMEFAAALVTLLEIARWFRILRF